MTKPFVAEGELWLRQENEGDDLGWSFYQDVARVPAREDIASRVIEHFQSLPSGFFTRYWPMGHVRITIERLEEVGCDKAIRRRR